MEYTRRIEKETLLSEGGKVGKTRGDYSTLEKAKRILERAKRTRET